MQETENPTARSRNWGAGNREMGVHFQEVEWNHLGWNYPSWATIQSPAMLLDLNIYILFYLLHPKYTASSTPF